MAEDIPIRIRLAGVLAVEVGTRELDLSGLGRLGTLACALLVTERRAGVSRDELADVMWDGEPPATWPHALRNVVGRVRRALADAVSIESAGGAYVLRLPDGAVVDVEEAVAALDAARRDRSVDVARRAVSSSSGLFLTGLGGAWVEARQAALDALHVDALEALAESALDVRDAALAVGAASDAVALQPLRESAHRLLMRAHAAAGNRAEALRSYERCRRTLADELGVDPSPATEAAYLALLAETAGRPGRLVYPITSFVGRRRDVAAVARSLESSRLVSLVGMGGIGKSRLAIEVASLVEARFPDGTFLVELAGLRDPGLVAGEVLAVLAGPPAGGEPAVDVLVRRIGAAHLLVVLDNCEHLVSACGELSLALLRRCPNARIVTTTREPLGVGGETTWAVPPLAQDDAVQLFVERSGTNDGDLGAAEIARRLDGIPLAIELAAGWARTLPAADIAARLDDRFELLSTLRSTLDWSYAALPADEAALLRGLSVFAGGFTLAAATAVSAVPEVELLRALSALVDRSLVVVQRSGRTLRYGVLETVREYLAIRLTDAGEAAAWQRRMLAWAVELAESGGEQSRWLENVEAEHDNLRAALSAAGGADAELGARLAVAMGRFWEVRGYWGEGRSHLATWTEREDVPTSLRAGALNATANLAQHQRDYGAARTAFDRCLAVRAAAGDELGAAAARHGLANIAFLTGHVEAARAAFAENLEVARRLGAGAVEAASLLNLGVIEQARAMRGLADGTEAAALLEQARAAFGRLGDRQRVALALENLGTLAASLGDDTQSRARQEASLAIRREIGDRAGIAVSLRALTRVALRQHDCPRSRTLADEYVAIERELGRPYDVAEALAVRAEVATQDGDVAAAARLLDESIAVLREGGDAPVPAWIEAARTALGA